MKIIIIYIVLFLNGFNSAIGQEYYYWAYGKKHLLEIHSEKQYILINGDNKGTLAQSLGISKQNISDMKRVTISKNIVNDQGFLNTNPNELHWGFVDVPISKENIKSSDLVYSAPYFYANGKEVGLTQFFYVKLKQPQDFSVLENLANENKVEIVGKDEFMPLWYILSSNRNSNGNALEMANFFYETGKFVSAQPDLLEDNLFQCRNDPLFNQQWHLSNTGQFGGTVGNDIQICEAWNITEGCGNIIVAVIDHGLEPNHPDFNNISPISFDTETGASPAPIVYGSHGVPVAGIIGAAANNTIGVAGIAPGIQLMSINNSLQATPLSRQNRAAGINFAWQNGASVINNSWSSSIVYQIIDDAIGNAVTLGRNGLGSVVFFSSGNDNEGTISYPSNNPNVISVGALSMCNERKSPTSCDGENWGSNFGIGLDVMAPGVRISTTDRVGNNGYNSSGVSNDYPNRDYTSRFNGTSAAAPQVSAIAALLLSINPNLTRIQVRDIIERTTKKIPAYTFTMGMGERANLTWNNQVGYGVVNAKNAVQEVLRINGPSNLCSTSTFTLPNLQGTISWSVSPTRLFSGSTSGTGSSAILSPFHTNSSGQATITFTVTTACGTITIPKTFWVGKPAIPGAITGNTTPGPGSYTPYYINNLPAGATSMSWGLPYCVGCSQPWSFVSGQNDILITAQVGDSDGYVQAMGVNACGTGGASLLYVTTNGPCDPCARMYPNPVSNEMTLEWMDSDGFVLIEEIDAYQVSLYNAVGGVILTETTNKPSIKIDLSQLKNGFYYLHIENKDGLIRKQIRVER